MTPEQTALIEKARSSVRAARLLSERGFFDFAVSREGLAYSKHSAVIAAFGQNFAKSGRVPSDVNTLQLNFFEEFSFTNH